MAALAQVIRQEIAKLCSSKVSSIQTSRDAKSLQGFSWDSLIDEATEHAPTLVQLLMESTKKGKKRQGSQGSQRILIGMCLSLLCRHRNQKMSLVQKLLGLILYSGHSAKQVRIAVG